MQKLLLVLSLILSVALSKAQNATTSPNIKFEVNSKIKDEVDKYVSQANGVVLGKMDMKMVIDDSVYLDTERLNKKFDFFAMAYLYNDTLSFTGFAGMFAGMGFKIFFERDSCRVYHFVKSDDVIGMYKLNKGDTTYSPGINVPTTYSRVVLANKPEYKEGEIIMGYVELKSFDFYERANGLEKKYRTEIKAYFKGKVNKIK